MWSSCSNSLLNGEGWEVASSRKSKNQSKSKSQFPPTAVGNRNSSPDRRAVGPWKGTESYNVDGQTSAHWVNPSSDIDQEYEQQGWKDSGKPQQGNANHEKWTTALKNAGDWGQYGKATKAIQSSPKPRSSESAIGKMDRQNLAVPPPLANGWQWRGRIGGGTNSNSLMALPPGKDARHAGANTSEENSELSKVLSKLLPSEQLAEPPHKMSRAGYRSSDSDTEVDNLLDSDDDFMSSDDCGSEGSDVSHETLKKNKWFKSFF